ncbi:hypothetical protein KUCAC02_035883, partial [Chaenocephalus aceratus]
SRARGLREDSRRMLIRRRDTAAGSWRTLKYRFIPSAAKVTRLRVPSTDRSTF